MQIRSADRVLTQEELEARGARAAGGLRRLGVGEGESVALLLRNDLAFFEAAVAVRLAGARLVPINWHFHAEEIEYLLRDSGARVLVAHADLLARASGIVPPGTTVLAVETPPEIAAAYHVEASHRGVAPGDLEWGAWLEAQSPVDAPADPAGSVMLYTSGTTGVPKGVRRAPMTEAQADAYYRVVTEAFGVDPGARAVMTGPLYHSAPLGFAQASLRAGCELLLLMPRFEPEPLLALIEAERLTHMHLVPTMFVRLLRLPEATRARYDLSSLRCIVHGAAPCPPDVKRRMIEWLGPVVREYYGSTEASVVSGASAEEWLARPGTVGRPFEGVRLEIRDPDGGALPAGEPGEIWARLDVAPPFTYHNREADRRAIERDGLLTNGDIGYVDADGWLYLCDRKRDMIISGGVNIYPAEIEAALITHPAVHDCAVFGIPDDEYGEAVAAAVQPEPGNTPGPEALREFLAHHVARYKIPRVFDFHESLPRQDNGKIYKAGLREPYWRGRDRRI